MIKKTSKKALFEIDKIYNEDCLKTLDKLPDDSIDIVITSPPYNMNLRIRNGKYTSRQIVKELTTKYKNFDDNLPIDDFYALHSKILNELLRTSRRIFYNIQIVTGSKRAFFKMIGEFNEFLKDIVIWDKGHAEPAIRDGVMSRRTELVLIFEKEYPISRRFEDANFKRGTLQDIWHIKRERNKTGVHGATFPQELVQTILSNFSNKGDIVYDPFMGTGTTALVAKLMGRKYLGSEIDKDYYKASKKRIKEFTSLID